MKSGLSPLPDPCGWDEMDTKERFEYLQTLGMRLLCHRYRYYVLDQPIMDDWLYDLIERMYERLCRAQGITSVTENLVGFNPDTPEGQQAAILVESEEL